MGFWDFLKKRKSESAAPSRTPAQVIQQALASQGIATESAEVSEVIDLVSNSIEFKPVLPEALMYSDTAELEFTGSKYVVRLSMFLLGGGGGVPQDVKDVLGSCAVYWACASEIAKAKGVPGFALAEGQRIAVCDYAGFGQHPLYTLFPDLLKKTVSR